MFLWNRFMFKYILEVRGILNYFDFDYGFNLLIDLYGYGEWVLSYNVYSRVVFCKEM